ncbi:MAG: hypothetical protein BWY83_01262 [bacterium ADurb.Bin478]|nr:MAG: hypothetical protein BWY83_01262 [bacterium ADurb.Bin478]
MLLTVRPLQSGIGGAKDRHTGSADGGGDVHRPRIGGHHDRRALKQSRQLRQAGGRSEHDPRGLRHAAKLFRLLIFTRSPDGHQAERIGARQHVAQFCETRQRPAFGRPPAGKIDHRHTSVRPAELMEKSVGKPDLFRTKRHLRTAADDGNLQRRQSIEMPFGLMHLAGARRHHKGVGQTAHTIVVTHSMVSAADPGD